MELSPCPIEFETEVLVSGSLEISSEKLARGLSWLATSLKEQNKILGSLCGQVDALQETASLPRTEPQERRMSMKDEMLSMQLNALKHEVGALPQPADLERQRERIMAEVQSVSNSLFDRQRDSNERLQKDLAEATESLCSQLGRIGDSVSARLVVLESHMASQPALAAASNQSRVELPGSGVQAQVLPALDPLSASNVAADDTEDQTDGTFGLWCGGAIARCLVLQRSQAYWLEGPVGGLLPALLEALLAPLLFLLGYRAMRRSAVAICLVSILVAVFAKRNNLNIAEEEDANIFFTAAHCFEFLSALLYAGRTMLLDNDGQSSLTFTHLMMIIQQSLAAYFWLQAFEPDTNLNGCGLGIFAIQISCLGQLCAYIAAASLYVMFETHEVPVHVNI